MTIEVGVGEAPLEISVAAYLIEVKGRKVLIDTGLHKSVRQAPVKELILVCDIKARLNTGQLLGQPMQQLLPPHTGSV